MESIYWEFHTKTLTISKILAGISNKLKLKINFTVKC